MYHAASMIVLEFRENQALTEEMEFYAGTDDGQKTYASLNSASDVVRFVESSNEYVDLKHVAARLRSGRVLDVGVAYGVTSAYLAAHGHRVTAVEPSFRLCRDMEEFFRKIRLPVEVVQGIGEAIDQIQGEFDAVVFNSSLHHCNDVSLTLRNANKKLRRGGMIFLVNEPVLKFYRTKAWFYRTLKENPEKLGHYGGNEHIYRYGEYVNFLTSAGFSDVQSALSFNYSANAKRASWDSPLRFGIKKIFYKAMGGVLRPAVASEPLKRLSILNTVIFATKN